MRRRRSWVEVVILWVFLLGSGYLGLWLAVPGWVSQQLHDVTSDALTIGQARLGFPFKLILSDALLVSNNPGTLISSRRIEISPLWLSWRRKIVWLNSLEVDGLHLQLRRTPQGTLIRPAFDSLVRPSSAVGASVQPWRVVVHAIRVSDATIGFVDEKTAPPFRGSLTNLSLMAGPLAFPVGFNRLSLAIQGRIMGAQQHAASVFCSGWVHLEQRTLDASCQLEPLRLAAFEPYYRGPLQVRVYDATLSATGHLSATANQLEGRVKLEIANLSEADLSVLGNTLVDVKKLGGDADRTLTGEIQIAGPLDQPSQWRVQLVPGNDIVQRLAAPLLERGVEIIQIKVGTQTIQVGLTPATEAAMSSIEAVSQQVEENLKLLAPPQPAPGAPMPEATPAPLDTPSEAPAPEATSPPQPTPPAAQPASGASPSEPARAEPTP